MKKIIITLFLILFIMGCSNTNIIEAAPPTDDAIEAVPDTTTTNTDTTGADDTTETETITDTTTTNDTTTDTSDTTTTTNTTTGTESTTNSTETTTETTTTSSNSIEVKEFTFDPKELTIKVGETVTFKNSKPDEGKKANQVELFKVRGQCGDIPKLSQVTAIQHGEEISFTFDQVGKCFYRDVYHGDYVGEISIE